MAKRRPNGDGLVRKREDGRWEGRIVAGHKKDGSPIYRAVFAEKQSELMPKLHQLKEQYAGVELTEDSSITLGEWLERWMEEYKKPLLRPSTYTGYSTDIRNHILPHLGSKKLTQLKTSDLQKLYNRLLESGRMKDNGKGNGLAPATVRGIHVILREALESAVREGLIPKNPADGTSPPKIHRKEKQVLTKDQLETFMKLIENDEAWHDFFYTEILTGMRAGEICGVRWEDFDEDKRTLRVVRSVDFVHKELVIGETKTEDGKRTIYLPIAYGDSLRNGKRNRSASGSSRISSNRRYRSIRAKPTASSKRSLKRVTFPTFACTTCAIHSRHTPPIRASLPRPCPKSLDTVRRASRWTTTLT